MFSPHEATGVETTGGFGEQMLPLAAKADKLAVVGQMHMDAHRKVKRGERSRLGPLK